MKKSFYIHTQLSLLHHSVCVWWGGGGSGQSQRSIGIQDYIRLSNSLRDQNNQ